MMESVQRVDQPKGEISLQIRCTSRYARSPMQFIGSRRPGAGRSEGENQMDELEVITAGERVMPGEAFLGDRRVLQ
jgi:hypothetical protein